MHHTIPTVIALLALALAGCAAKELRCDRTLEPINAAAANERAQRAGDDHGR